MTEHPGVEVISQDRAGQYAEGATQGAPNALQVADRFHLVSNLATAAERFFQQKRLRLPAERETEQSNAASGDRVVIPKYCEQLKWERRQKRRERYEEVHRLFREGLSQKAIGITLGMERKTVRRFLRSVEFPERAVSRRRSRLDRFRKYLEQRWREGCHNATQLWREIQQQGYEGGRGMVANLVSTFRAPGTKYFRASARASTSRASRAPSSPRQLASLLIRRPENRSARDENLLRQLSTEHPDVASLYSLVQDFCVLLRNRNVAGLPAWRRNAAAAGIPALQSFVAGLGRDRAAVDTAFHSPWSNGQVEGHVHRLKLIKRQMYGRAGFALLRRRVLPFRSQQSQCGP